jgi:hypothetical protein
MHVLTWMATRKKLSCTCGSKLYSRVATGGIFYLNFVSLFILLENSNTIWPLMNLKRRTIFETINHIWFGFWVLILLVVFFFLSTCVYADLVMFLLFVYQYLCLYWGAMIQLVWPDRGWNKRSTTLQRNAQAITPWCGFETICNKSQIWIWKILTKILATCLSATAVSVG